MTRMPPMTTMPPMTSLPHLTESTKDIYMWITIVLIGVIMMVIIVISIIVCVFVVVCCNKDKNTEARKRRYISGTTIDNMSQSTRLLPAISPNSQPSSGSRPTRSTSTSVVRFLQSTLDYIPFDGPELVGSVQVVPCTNLGGVFHFNEHSIFLKIPKDAIPTEVDLEVGVAIHGKFQFPENMRPISAILWLKLPEDFQFQKPIQIQLPHYLGLSKEEAESSKEVGYMLATSGREELNKDILFQKGNNDKADFCQRNGTIETDHIGYICLCASTSLIEFKSEYLLVSAVPKPTPSLRWTIEFFVVYSLDTFVEVCVHNMHSIHLKII